MTGEIWLGDVVRAARALGAGSPAEYGRIAALLGMGGRPADPRRAGPEPPGDGAPARQAPAREGDEDPALPRPADDPSVFGRSRRPARADTVNVLVPVQDAERPALRWATPSLPRPGGRDRARRPPHLSLLAPRSTAALLSMVLSRVTDEGELDVERATEELAHARPLSDLPRLPLPTLRYGVQILADTSGAMEPFARDVEEVVGQVRALAGITGTQVLRFADVPLRGAGPGSRVTWRRPYRPPRPRVRVLILSDLGAGGPALNPWRATEQEWRATIDMIRQRGCEPVALVPLPERYHPRWARGLLPTLAWDRGTTVGKASGVRT